MKNRNVGRGIAVPFVFLVLLSVAIPRLAHALDVPLYGRFENAFTHSGTVTNPYTDITATVIFTPPVGSAVSIPMYWDKGANNNTWRVRFSPGVTGTWTWTTSSANSGLNHQTGSFNVVPSTNKGSLILQPGATYHFAYQDKTPVWWFGETNWAAMQTNSEGLNHANLLNYINFRANQKFNVLHAQIYNTQGNEGGTPFTNLGAQTLNPAFFQEVDSRVDYLNQHDIVAGLVLAWGFGTASWVDFPSRDARLRFARYIAARYSGYNVYFLVAAEWGLWPNGVNDAQTVFDEIGQAVADTDPHDRLIGIHSDTSAAQSEFFAGKTWASFGDYQQYYGAAPATTVASDANREDLRAKLAASRDHSKPAINGEYAYFLRDRTGDGVVDKENSHDRAEFRQASWVLAMTGGYFVSGFGRTYLGGGNDPSTFSFIGGATTDDSRYTDAAADLTRLHDFFVTHEWWTLDPNDALVTGSGAHYCLARTGQDYVVYTNSTTSASLALGGAPSGTYTVKRYDPRVGTYSTPTTYTGTGPIALSSPDTQDYVYVVQNKAGFADGPVALWRLNESAGTSAADSSGHTNVGTISGGAAWLSNSRVGNGLTVDGTGYLSAGNPINLRITGSITLAAWMRPNTWVNASEYHFISKRGGTTDRGWALRKDVNTDLFEIIVSDANNASVSRKSSVVLGTNVWHHIVGVYDSVAQTMHVYVDGVQSDGAISGTPPALQRDSSQNVNLGRRPTNEAYFDGALDDARIYNRALSAAEIQALFNSYPAP
jgi:hypothetical protein